MGTTDCLGAMLFEVHHHSCGSQWLEMTVSKSWPESDLLRISTRPVPTLLHLAKPLAKLAHAGEEMAAEQQPPCQLPPFQAEREPGMAPSDLSQPSASPIECASRLFACFGQLEPPLKWVVDMNPHLNDVHQRVRRIKLTPIIEIMWLLIGQQLGHGVASAL